MRSVAGDEVLAICAAVARSNGIMHFETGAFAGKLLHHGDEGRDPDAAGNQQMLSAAPIRLKQVDGMRYPHFVAFAPFSCMKDEPPRESSTCSTLIS